MAQEQAALQAELTQVREQAESYSKEAARAQQQIAKAEGALQASKVRVAALEGERDRLRQALTQAQTQARAVPPDLVSGIDAGFILSP